MPEPNRPPWRVDADIAHRPIRQFIERRISVVLDCESCPNVVTWTPAELGQRFGTNGDKTFDWVGPRLRCSRCKSDWVRISRADSP